MFSSQRYPLSFWGTLDASILKQDERPSSGSEVSLYPSEASAIVYDSIGQRIVLGGCSRKSWFRNKLQRQLKDSEHQTSLFDSIDAKDFTPKELWKFKMSRGVEDDITDEAKRAGVWFENSRRFEWKIPYSSIEEELINYGSFLIRGEVDLVVSTEPSSEDLVGIEVKSISGYKGQKQVFGVWSKYKGRWIQEPEPKSDNLLQTVLYHHHFVLELNTYKYFKLVYLSREDGSRIEFNVDLVPENVYGLTRHRVYVNNKPYPYKLYSEDILDRYRYLHKHIVDDTLPDRDFDYRYDKTKIAKLAKAGLLGKTDMDLYNRGKDVVKGDWQCSYCPFKNMCYDSKDQPISYETSDITFDIQALIDTTPGEEDSNE